VTNGSPGVLTSGVFTESHSYDTAGIYTVKVTVTDDNGGTDFVTFKVIVDALS